MDRNYIAQQAAKMETKHDLLSLLNRIKISWFEDMGMTVKFHPFTMKQLNYYSNPNHTFHRYSQFKIKKKTGGFRQITAPRSKTFKLMLMCLNEMFKSIYSPSDFAMGFTEGRSVVSNASIHKGQNYIFNIDLKDFFPSIYRVRVRARLQAKPFCFNENIAMLLAGLCSMKISSGHNDGRDYVLPQGSPTSPIITNMICDNLDRRLAGLAKRFGLRYSRYADDITFSSMHNVYQTNGEFRTELRRIIEGQGFTINEAKTRLQKQGSRQEVTGLIVSDKLNVTQHYVRDIRNILFIWEHYGYNAAFTRFFPRYKAEKGHVKKGVPDLINVLDGKLMYLKMVKGAEDSVYIRLFSKYRTLADKAHSIDNTTEHGVTYVETIPLHDFEVNNLTEVIIDWVVPTSDDENGQPKPKRRTASFTLDGKRVYASVNKNVKKEDEQKKELLAISNCRDAKNKQFWLIHYVNKVTVPPAEPVNIEELSNELDALLNS